MDKAAATVKELGLAAVGLMQAVKAHPKEWTVADGAVAASERAARRAVELVEASLLRPLVSSSPSELGQPQMQAQLADGTERVGDRLAEVLAAVARHEAVEKEEDDGLEERCERELQETALQIDRAQKGLLTSDALASKENRTAVGGDAELQQDVIDGAVLDASRAILQATSKLVQIASLSQHERVARKNDPKTKHFYRRDQPWAEGFIDAATAVRKAADTLVRDANGFVRDHSGESSRSDDALIAAAKAMAATTATLMAAARAKADPYGSTHSSLLSSAKAVAAATQALVDACRKASQSLSSAADSAGFDDVNAERRRLELEAQARVLRLQRELERAQMELANLHGKSVSSGAPSFQARPDAAVRRANQSSAGPAPSPRKK